MTRVLLGCVLLSTLGCKKEVAAPPAQATPKAPALTAEMPDSPEARKFARGLLDNPITNWSPIDDRTFIYTSMSFAPDGTWTADAELTAGGESVPCKEVGEWSIDKAESEVKATMDWTIVKSSCARENGSTQRVSATRNEAQYKISYR